MLRALAGDTLRLVDDDPDLVLALGEQAFRDALAAGGPPVLGLAVPRRAADRLITDDCQCSAIWQGVPLDTQLALLRALLPEARRIGILRAPHSVWRTLPPAPPGLSLEAVTVPEPDRLGALLRRHLPEWDALLLPEDHSLFDGGAARLVLLTSYRQRVPVVGPDGALCAPAASPAPACCLRIWPPPRWTRCTPTSGSATGPRRASPAIIPWP